MLRRLRIQWCQCPCSDGKSGKNSFPQRQIRKGHVIKPLKWLLVIIAQEDWLPALIAREGYAIKIVNWLITLVVYQTIK